MPVADASDAQLVSAAREGSQDAYKELVTRYQGHGFRKKTNRDYFEQATVLFLEQFLL